MADRSVTVFLRAQIAEYQRKMAEAAAETAGFKKSADSAGDSVDDLGRRSSRAGAEVDKLSGRLAIARDLALTFGPAAVPITAAMIPALTGLAAAAGAVVAGVGVGVVAFQGFGDALEAVRTAELEPTAENLQAAREQLEALDPAAAAVVRQFSDLVPQLKGIRDAGATEIFPGIAEAMDALETRLPFLERFAAKVGEVLGDNAGGIGNSLASGRWTPFLDFLEDEVPGALDAVIKTAGDLTHGLSELWMAFDPLNDDVISGLQRGAQAFDDWASGLAQTEGFANFLDYLETTGPQVLDTVGSIADAIVQLLQALAPLGGPSLAAIRGLADAIAMLADSDLAGPLLAGAAAFAAYNRAAQVASRVTGVLTGGIAGLSSAGAAGAAVVGLTALGAAAQSIEERFDKAAPGVEALTASLLALGSADAASALAGQLGDLGGALDLLNADGLKGLSADLAEFSNEGGILGNTLKGLSNTPLANGIVDPKVARDLRETSDRLQVLDEALAGLVTSGSPEQAQDIFNQLAQTYGLNADQVARLREQLPGFAEAMAGAGNEAKMAADGMDEAAQATQRFSESLAALNGWLDRRAALRGYRESVADLGEALKDGFQPQDAETIDAVGRSISQVAAGIQGEGKRADFLSGARASLVDLAENSGPRARAEVERLVGAMDDAGVTRPPLKLDVDGQAALSKITGVQAVLDAVARRKATATVDADTGPAQSKGAQTRRMLDDLNAKRAMPKIGVDNAQALAGIGGVASRLAGLRNKTVYITTVERRVGPGGQGNGYDPSAHGNLFESVRVFARGGQYPGDVANAHQPELAGPGVMRVWREPETQGEAYIPLANDGRRGRAKSILEEVAARFDGDVEWYATGGTRSGDKRRGRDILVDGDDVRVRAADRGLTGKAARDFAEQLAKTAQRQLKAFDKSIDDISAAVDAQTDRVKDSADAIQDETQKRDQIVAQFESVADAISDLFERDLFTTTGTGAVDVFSNTSPYGDPNSVLDAALGDIERYDELYAKLQARGLDGPALAYSAAEGLDALETLNAYSDGQLATFEVKFEKYADARQATGTAVAQTQFGEALAAQNSALAQANSFHAQEVAQLAAIEARLAANQAEQAAAQRQANQYAEQAAQAAKQTNERTQAAGRDRRRGRR